MLKLMLSIIAVVALLTVSVWLFTHLLPWVIAILAVAGLVAKLYHIWLRSNGGGPAPVSC